MTETSEPAARHRHGSRLRRTLLAAFVTVSVAVPVTGTARPAAVPAPVPAVLPPLPAVTPAALDERYTVSRAAIRAAERTAAGHGDRLRAAALRVMAAPERRFLSFDGREGGRAVEVFGDLSRAEWIAVLVPGADTDLDRYGLLRGGSMRLQRELGTRAAVVAWLGYRTPSTVSPQALTPARADEAAPGLRVFVRALRTARPAARVSLLCHSYGSVVCGRASAGLDVANIVLYGSAGTTADNAAGLRTRAAVWAGRGAGDWIAGVPHTRIRLPFAVIGFGADPVSPEFGARVFAAGDGGHSDYLRLGFPSLRNIARIVSGRLPAGEVRGA
ncbi:alpha/beta hydrolase [Streptosporangium sp. NPDC051022]|uniref:alpha/beta hydrolase n=1 Tax=Streptosporangium sp. NPDC051022 TaxID=3155752 RepID=UPI00343B0B20